MILITWSLSKHASLCRKSIAYGNSDAVCYVTIERLANNAVRVSKLICEEYEINMSSSLVIPPVSIIESITSPSSSKANHDDIL